MSMDIVQTIRWIVFMALYVSLIIPGYLALRLHLPEVLFLYGPILSFWTILIYSQIEKSQQANNQITNQGSQ